MSSLAMLAMAEIIESPVALRTVNEESEQFLEMIDSVNSKGILNPINVRVIPVGQENAGKYCIVDGLHRYTANKRVGNLEIPVQILDIGEAEALEAQVIANIQKVDTKPVEYAKQLKRILAVNPLMTIADLAGKVNKSSAWISERFGLLVLSKEIQELVDAGELKLSNAYSLSKLPEAEQKNYLDRALTLPPVEFAPLVDQRKKEIIKAQREGKDGKPEEFIAIPVARKLAEVKAELESPKVAGQIIASEGATNVEQAFAAAIKWVLRMDSGSIADSKSKWEARQKAMVEARERAAGERAAKKAEKATEKVAKLQEEAAEAKAEAEKFAAKKVAV